MVQGKTVTLFSGTGPGLIPAYPTTVTAASLPLPTKYKSKKSNLVVTTTIEESCPADNIATVVSVAGFFLEPDPSAIYWIECGSVPSPKTVVKQWFLPSEAAGGPAIPAGSTVDMLMSSSNGTGSAGGSIPMTVKVESLK